MHTYASSSDRSITENNAAESSATVNTAAPPAHGPIEYGFTPATAGHFRDNPVPEKGDCTPGRIVRLDRNRVLVASSEGLLHLPYPSHGPAPATGDWVWLGHNTAGEPAVVAILPRLSALSRKRAFESSSEEQVLGANIDIVAVVVPMDRPLTHNRLERTLVAAWDSGATPLVVITKADLANIADDVVGEVLRQAAGVDVVTTSAEQGDGIDELLRHIPAGATLVMLGPSGAGKSTLINALTGRRQQATGAVRAGDGKGRHTTTSRELVPLPGGAVLMDTPGVRGFGLFDADDGIEEMFGDLEELFEQCRFSDCSHQAEPGCAVLEALADCSLDQRRWDSFLKLQRELAALNRKHDAAARRAYQREWHQKVVSAERGQRAAERYRHDRAEERSARKGKRRKR
ncbi:ribosome small subunit-dependent GTPase A [Paenarthrobacter ureafaciens]|uniref:ribosome small subunit-dependent GTPase A n=1 Tax=Paenarthrobacter ureafaciens TaxID=37931 RepID=UPI003743F4F2